jgi:hypothetical protein
MEFLQPWCHLPSTQTATAGKSSTTIPSNSIHNESRLEENENDPLFKVNQDKVSLEHANTTAAPLKPVILFIYYNIL